MKGYGLRQEPEAVYQLVEHGPGMVVITDVQGTIIAVNKRCMEETGFARDEVLGKTPRIWNSGRQPKSFYDDLWRTILDGRIWEGSFCNRRKGGALFWTRAIIVPVYDDDGNIHMFASVHDIVTVEHRLRERLTAIVESTRNGIITVNSDCIIENVNPAGCKLFGYEEQQLVGIALRAVLPESYARVQEHGCCSDEAADDLPREETCYRQDGSQFYANVEISPFEADTGQKYAAIVTDRTNEVEYRRRIEGLNSELEAKNRYLEQLSVIDHLTGLPNRRRFEERLSQDWERCRRDQTEIAVLIMDIDHFKDYNDHYGHPNGDACLQKAGEAMAATVKRSVDTVARYGGEEFAVVLPEAGLKDARRIGEEIRKAIEGLRMPHARSPVSEVVTISVGAAAVIPNAEAKPSSAVQAADEALYRAKEGGRNRVA